MKYGIPRFICLSNIARSYCATGSSGENGVACTQGSTNATGFCQNGNSNVSGYCQNGNNVTHPGKGTVCTGGATNASPPCTTGSTPSTCNIGTSAGACTKGSGA